MDVRIGTNSVAGDFHISQSSSLHTTSDNVQQFSFLQPTSIIKPNEFLLHPTNKTKMFYEIIAGNYCYNAGQTMYNYIRSCGVASRHLQASMIRIALSSVTYEEVMSDWSRHLATIQHYYDLAEPEVVAIVLRTWKLAIKDHVLSLLKCYSRHLDTTINFECYIDWLATIGIIPVFTPKKNVQKLSICNVHSSTDMKTVQKILKCGYDITCKWASHITHVSVAPYHRVSIVYNTVTEKLTAKEIVSGRKATCYVIKPFVVLDKCVLFNTPIERISQEVLRVTELNEHVKLCQLINTAPVKVLIGKKDASAQKQATTDDILKKIDSQHPETDSKKKMLKMLINLANMDKVSDVKTAVQGFLDETSRSLIPDDIIAGTLGLQKSQLDITGHITDKFKNKTLYEVTRILEENLSAQFNNVEKLTQNNIQLRADLEQVKKELIKYQTELLNAADKDKKQDKPQFPMINESLIKPYISDVLNVSATMGPQDYVANSFFAHFVPEHRQDNHQLTKLWNSELVSYFKLEKLISNQGDEVGAKISHATIEWFISMFIESILGITDAGFAISSEEAYMCEEDLFSSLFDKSRLSFYIDDIGRHAVKSSERYTAICRDSNTSRDDRSS